MYLRIIIFVPTLNAEYPVITPGLPPPLVVIVGSVLQPEPLLFIVTIFLALLVRVAVADALTPASPAC